VEQAKVTVEYGETINTGNFNSVRLTARIEYPCDATKPAVDTTFFRLWKECKDQIEKQKQELDL
jgi:hypothetical protein